MDAGDDDELTSGRNVSSASRVLALRVLTYVEPLGYVFEQRHHFVTRM